MWLFYIFKKRFIEEFVSLDLSFFGKSDRYFSRLFNMKCQKKFKMQV